MVTTTERSCHFCGDSPTVPSSTGAQISTLVNAPHWTPEEYVRVDVCSDCHRDLAKPPRRARRSTRPAAVRASDWNMLVRFTASTAGVTPPIRH